MTRWYLRNPAKISPTSWTTYSKYYIGFLDNETPDMIQHLWDFHSTKVNPQELVVSLNFYDSVASEPAFKKCPTLRHYLLTTQYTSEKTLTQSSGANFAATLDSACLTSLAKKPKEVEQVEKTLNRLSDKYLPILEKLMGQVAARLELTEYMNLIVRCLFAKPWPENLELKVPGQVGKFSEAKVKSLGVFWAELVDLRNPGADFAAAAGLAPEKVAEPEAEASRAVDLGGLRALTRSVSAASDPVGPCTLKRGDEVTVIRKMTWPMPTKANPEFRKDHF